MNLHVRLPALCALLTLLSSPFSTSGCEESPVVVSEALMCDALDLAPVDPANAPYTLRGWPLLFPEVASDGSVSLRAPAVLHDTELTLTNASGRVVQRVLVHPDPERVDARLGLVEGCGDFRQGVASGDPGPDHVFLWTRVTPRDPSASELVRWQIAARPDFSELMGEGEVLALPEHDHTVHARAERLEPGHTYYYRFVSARGERSEVGRTRTTPAADAERVRLAVVSCSSLYSGYFNAYQRVSERGDVDALIHLGDYLYDFVDDEERVRVPAPEPEVPHDLAGWRARHAFYLSDPNLRAARAAMPWIMIWDNHDLDPRALSDGGVQAFREWNPITPPVSAAAPEIAYRRIRFGELVDVLITDALLFRSESLVPGSDEPSILGATQYEWLTSEIESSGAAWRIIGSQKIVAPIEGSLALLGGSTWDAYEASRAQLFGFLADGSHDDNLFLSGDAHITVASDLPDARPSATAYDAATGAGSIGVELMPGSVSRGNVDESVNGSQTLVNAVDRSARESNPHFRFMDLVRHGYGLVEVDMEHITAELWYSPILEPSESEELGQRLRVTRGANHWERESGAPN